MNQWKHRLHLIDEDELNHKLNENHLRLSTQYSRLPIHRFSISLHKNLKWQYSINRVNLILVNQKTLLKASTGLALWDSKTIPGEKK